MKIWQFISGGGEQDESQADAASREGFEEAQIPANLQYDRLDSTCTIPAAWFSAWKEWPAELLVVSEHAFSVELETQALVLSDEHDDVRWVHYEAAMKMLAFDSNKCALWELHERLFPSSRERGSVEHSPDCACMP